MSEWVNSAGRDPRLRIQAWVSSLVLHAAIMGLVILLGTRMTPAPREEPFRWNVAMVEPVSFQEPTAAAQPSLADEARSTPIEPIASPKPLVQQTVRPSPTERYVETPTQSAVPRVEAKPTVERHVEPVRKTEPTGPVRELRPSGMDPPPIAPAQAEADPAAIERPAKLLEPSPAPVEPVIETETPQTQQMEQAVQQAEVAHEPAPILKTTPPVVPERVASQPVEQPTTDSVQQHVESAHVTRDHETPTEHARSVDSSPTDQQAVQEERTVVAKAAPTAPRPRADYGWVRDALWRRIVEMKHYPAQARLSHLEGKVILRAVIRADGHLGDLSVKESSGHRLLDEAAMDVIRRICPVPLKYALGKPEIVVMIPIDYRLE